MSKTATANLAPFDPSSGLADKRIPITDVAKQISKRIGEKIQNKEDTSVMDVLKFAWVPADKIFINYKRQRWPEPKHMKKLHGKWNIMCVTPLQCRYDPVEDRFYGADGQQHMTVWLVKYGLLTMVPCFYVESTDENVESIQLLALNTDSEPMAKFFIHHQKIMMGDKDAMSLEKAVTAANCETAYKKRAPGCITHISHLQDAYENYGGGALTLILSKMRQFWPQDKIEMLNIRYAAAEMHHDNNMEEVTEQRDDLKKELEIANLRLKGKRHPDDNGIMVPSAFTPARVTVKPPALNTNWLFTRVVVAFANLPPMVAAPTADGVFTNDGATSCLMGILDFGDVVVVDV